MAWDLTSLQPYLSSSRRRLQVVENRSSIQTRTMDPAVIDVDDLVEELTGSTQPDNEDPIPLRVSNGNFVNDAVFPASLRIHELPAHIDLCDIKRLLCTNGFSSAK